MNKATKIYFPGTKDVRGYVYRGVKIDKYKSDWFEPYRVSKKDLFGDFDVNSRHAIHCRTLIQAKQIIDKNIDN